MKTFFSICALFLFSHWINAQSIPKQWHPINPIVSSADFNSPVMVADELQDFYVAYFTGDGHLVVKKFDGTDWVNYGTTSYYTTNLTKIAMAAFRGTVYVAFFDANSNGNLVVVGTNTGTDWTYIGNTVGDPNSSSISLAVDPTPYPGGVIYVKYVTGTPANLVLQKYDLSAAQWGQIGLPQNATNDFSQGSAFDFHYGFVNLLHFVKPTNSADPSYNQLALDTYNPNTQQWINVFSHIGVPGNNSNPQIKLCEGLSGYPLGRSFVITYATNSTAPISNLVAQTLYQNADGSWVEGPVIYNQPSTLVGAPILEKDDRWLGVNSDGPFLMAQPTPNSQTNTSVIDLAQNVAFPGQNNGSTPLGNTNFIQGTIFGGGVEEVKMIIFNSSSSALNAYEYDFQNVRSVTSPNKNATYLAGGQFFIDVTFDCNVNVGGTPRLRLNTHNSTASYATFQQQPAPNVARFVYTVQQGDQTPLLDYSDVSSLDLNGGSIIVNGTASTQVNAFLPAPGSPGSLSYNDSIALITLNPRILTVTLPDGGRYRPGTAIYIQLNVDRPVTVSGSPVLGLTIGSSRAVATYASGSGTNTLKFVYTIQPGDYGTFSIDPSLTLNGAVIADASNYALVNLIVFYNPSNVFADGIYPSIAISTPASQPFTLNSTAFLFSATKPLANFNSNSIQVTNGTLSGFVANSSTSYSATITPTASGTLTVTIPAGACTDAVGNPNNASSFSGTVQANGKVTNYYPNPAYYYLNIAFQGINGGGTPCQLTLVNSGTGASYIMNGIITNNFVRFNVSQLPNGVYAAVVTWYGGRASFNIEISPLN